jgi:Family of unknown function (DUF5694)
MLARVILTIILFHCSLGMAAEDDAPAQVMLFGVFHFSNPGNDVVKTEQIDVMTPANQVYLEDLARRIADFNPTVMLLEFDPENLAPMQEKYRQFVAGTHELGSNEIYQLGFRIANMSGLETVYSFDEQQVGWEADELFEYMEKHDPEMQAKVNGLIAEITEAIDLAHTTKSLAQLLMQSNDPQQDRLNKYFYVLTNQVGAGHNFVGADSAASWWRRNFRMYANIQKHAQPGERVVAIGGQGHTAILKDLLALDADRIAVDVGPYISAP